MDGDFILTFSLHSCCIPITTHPSVGRIQKSVKTARRSRSVGMQLECCVKCYNLVQV